MRPGSASASGYENLTPDARDAVETASGTQSDAVGRSQEVKVDAGHSAWEEGRSCIAVIVRAWLQVLGLPRGVGRVLAGEEPVRRARIRAETHHEGCMCVGCQRDRGELASRAR